jgi:tetratricopeptide (TPR) repeat protein
MEKEDSKQNKWKSAVAEHYVAPIIIGILLLLVSYYIIDSYKNSQEIDYHFGQAYYFNSTGQFEKEISEYNEILKISYNKFPDKYALAQKNTGKAYINLANAKEEETNAQNAINAYQKALEIYTYEEYPLEYADTQRSLGWAYINLAMIRDKETNAQNAINASLEAQREYTYKKYPLEYADTQNILGWGYINLADVKDPETNVKSGIDTFRTALTTYKDGEDLLGYTQTQSNLGNAYYLSCIER